MSARRMTLVLGTAAGAFLAAGLIPLATAPSAQPTARTISPAVDPDFISATDPLLAILASRTSELPTLTTILRR